MGATAVDEVLATRFRIDRPPTLVARRHPRAQVAFSRMRSDHPMRGRSLAVPPEAAFSFHVPLTAPFFSDLWMAGKRRTLPLASLGDAFLFDLNENPTVDLDTPFDSLRFYVPQAALDEMADEAGIPRVKGLHARQFGGRNLVMYGFAQAFAGAMARPGDGSAMFASIPRSPFSLTSFASVAACRSNNSLAAAWPMAAAARLLTVRDSARNVVECVMDLFSVRHIRLTKLRATKQVRVYT